MKTIEELERKLAEPSNALIEDMSRIDGDLMLLGVGGKMGPSMARLAVQAIEKAGISKKVYGVSRFSEGLLKEELKACGVEPIAADLMNEEELQELPNVKNIIYLAGTKFGTTGNEHYTWAMNTYIPGRIAEKYRESRIVVFSTGNVYPLTPVFESGATESTPPSPVGEYGQSCLGRERIFQYFSQKYQIPMVIYRLNYAIDMRYGVLLEIAKSVQQGKPIDLSMGHINCIWQGDANEIALRSLNVCTTPPTVLNVTGPETISVRWVANEFGKRFGITPVFQGTESPNALLSNSSKVNQLFGYPRVSLGQIVDWLSEWLRVGGTTWNKPTHFQEREGKF